jgi:hypothetical protein
MAQLPIAVGLVLCEQVVIEEGTRNVTPVNCFNVREVDDIPGRASFCVLAWLADGKGEKVAELVVQRLDNLDAVFRSKARLVFRDPGHTVRFLGRIRDCEFPVEGYYEVMLLIDRELIAHRKFQVQRKGGKNG